MFNLPPPLRVSGEPADVSAKTRPVPINRDIMKRKAAFSGSNAEGTATVLLVEDEGAVRHTIPRNLTVHGYHVLPAENSDSALALWQTHQSNIEMLLTGMIMPGGLSGRAVARQYQLKPSDLKILYTSEDDLETSTDANGLGDRSLFVPKPFRPDQLLAAVRASLEGNSSPDFGTYAQDSSC